MTWHTVMPTDSDMAGHSPHRGTLKSYETLNTDACAGGGFSNQTKRAGPPKGEIRHIGSKSLMAGELDGDDRNSNWLYVGIDSLF